jgi:sec-independent protein translocase protein TatA
MPHFGPTELILILVIIVIFFGVGRLPEVFGAVGKGLREFRKASTDESKSVEKPDTEDEGTAAKGAE